jgi:hypothetical protein
MCNTFHIRFHIFLAKLGSEPGIFCLFIYFISLYRCATEVPNVEINLDHLRDKCDTQPIDNQFREAL